MLEHSGKKLTAVLLDSNTFSPLTHRGNSMYEITEKTNHYVRVRKNHLSYVFLYLSQNKRACDRFAFNSSQTYLNNFNTLSVDFVKQVRCYKSATFSCKLQLLFVPILYPNDVDLVH